ncbi:hypothetical protein ACFX2A_038798 [Malus domestica]
MRAVQGTSFLLGIHIDEVVGDIKVGWVDGVVGDHVMVQREVVLKVAVAATGVEESGVGLGAVGWWGMKGVEE